MKLDLRCFTEKQQIIIISLLEDIARLESEIRKLKQQMKGE